jgi:single-strand DNA-binding protein
MVAKLTLVGNLGAEPEVRYTADGRPIVTCRVASNYRKRDPESHDWADATNWYRVTTFGRLAERLSEQLSAGRLSKGSRIIVFGRLEASAYMDRSNQPQPSLDVVADDLLFADNRPRGEGDYGLPDFVDATSAPARTAPAPQRRPAPDDTTDLEDLPF